MDNVPANLSKSNCFDDNDQSITCKFKVYCELQQEIMALFTQSPSFILNAIRFGRSESETNS